MYVFLGSHELEEPTFAILGDSHGKMLAPAINHAAEMSGKKGIFVGSGGCLALLGVSQLRQGFESCDERADAFLSYLKANPNITHVILISRWAIYANSVRYKNTIGSDVYIQDKLTKVHSKDENRKVFDRSFVLTMDALNQLNLDVTIVAQIPESEWGASDMAFAKLIRPDLKLYINRHEYDQRQQNVSQVFSRYKNMFEYQVVYPHEKMCDMNQCKILHEGVSIYRDNNHITRTFALTFSDFFAEVFETVNK